jgi:hypothetical protein
MVATDEQEFPYHKASPESSDFGVNIETRNRDGTPLVRIEVMGPHGYGELKLWMREWMRLPRATYT